jgi:hypothetical protein
MQLMDTSNQANSGVQNMHCMDLFNVSRMR